MLIASDTDPDILEIIRIAVIQRFPDLNPTIWEYGPEPMCLILDEWNPITEEIAAEIREIALEVRKNYAQTDSHSEEQPDR